MFQNCIADPVRWRNAYKLIFDFGQAHPKTLKIPEYPALSPAKKACVWPFMNCPFGQHKDLTINIL